MSFSGTMDPAYQCTIVKRQSSAKTGKCYNLAPGGL
ncbi:macrophage migration inhibitory factor [Moniliophthora roreri]|nr:macrophage migration inhibitory factor [Moniliophthora roreri]